MQLCKTAYEEVRILKRLLETENHNNEFYDSSSASWFFISSRIQ